jgi:hydrogenase expression/formation protein HypE
LFHVTAAVKARRKDRGGDTKSREQGKADGIFINTSGIGALSDGRNISASKIKKSDKIIISGEVAPHVAVISERNGLTFDPPITK